MEAIVNLISGLGLVGSLALLGWGLSLCLRHGLGEYAYGRERGRGARHAGFASAVIAAALVVPAPGASAQDDGEPGFMLLHGERVYGAAARQDAREGLMWVQCAADQDSPVARFSRPRLNSMSIANASANDH